MRREHRHPSPVGRASRRRSRCADRQRCLRRPRRGRCPEQGRMDRHAHATQPTDHAARLGGAYGDRYRCPGRNATTADAPRQPGSSHRPARGLRGGHRQLHPCELWRIRTNSQVQQLRHPLALHGESGTAETSLPRPGSSSAVHNPGLPARRMQLGMLVLLRRRRPVGRRSPAGQVHDRCRTGRSVPGRRPDLHRYSTCPAGSRTSSPSGACG